MKAGEVVLYIDREGDVNNLLVGEVRQIEGEEHPRVSGVFLNLDHTHKFSTNSYTDCIERVVDAEYGDGLLKYQVPFQPPAEVDESEFHERTEAAKELVDAAASAGVVPTTSEVAEFVEQLKAELPATSRQPSAADLDAVAEEQKAKDATAELVANPELDDTLEDEAQAEAKASEQTEPK